jgi:hypothetical protein
MGRMPLEHPWSLLNRRSRARGRRGRASGPGGCCEVCASSAMTVDTVDSLSRPSNPDEAVTSPLRAAFPPLQRPRPSSVHWPQRRTNSTNGAPASGSIHPSCYASANHPVSGSEVSNSSGSTSSQSHEKRCRRGQMQTCHWNHHRPAARRHVGTLRQVQWAFFPRPSRACQSMPRLNE